VAGCSEQHAVLALSRAKGDMCDALDVLPDVMNTLDYDNVTALVQMTLCTTPRARAVLDMTGGDVNAAADIINRQNKNKQQNGHNAPVAAPVTAPTSSVESVVPVVVRECPVTKVTPVSEIIKDVPSPKELSVLCWNIDGLSDEGLHERLSGVISVIKNQIPHVVMLQEVVAEHVDRLKQSLGVTYEIVWGDRSSGYFNTILIHKKHGHSTSRRTVRFPGSIMGRHLVIAQCTIFKKEFTFLTSHFESMKDHARERVAQLQYTCREMDRCEGCVVFGGDTNLRDSDCGILPNTYHDLWELAGRPKDLKYTWDMSINHNLKMRSKAALRFDRMFIRKESRNPIKVKSMRSVGKTKLMSCDLYPSDHWGILAHLAWD